jgi:hypothetical protein
MPRRVESGCRLAEQQVHLLLAIPGRRSKFQRALLDLAGEKLFGQRWTGRKADIPHRR